MIPSYYKSPSNDFTLIQGDCNETLSKFSFGFDMVFADPPYFLSSGGISCQSGKVVCVDKGDWDKSKTPQEMDAFKLRWLTSVRAHMKDNARYGFRVPIIISSACSSNLFGLVSRFSMW